MGQRHSRPRSYYSLSNFIFILIAEFHIRGSLHRRRNRLQDDPLYKRNNLTPDLAERHELHESFYTCPNLHDATSFLGTTNVKSDAEPASIFYHQPLDLQKASIRLVEVLQPGPKGTIQCIIRHVQLDDKISQPGGQGKSIVGSQNRDKDSALRYSCLSYVWGVPEDTHCITMNGRPIPTHKNLWRFLKEASYLPA